MSASRALTSSTAALLIVGRRPDPAQPVPQPVHGGQFGIVAVTASGPAVAVQVPVQRSLIGKLFAIDPVTVDQHSGSPQGQLGVMSEKHLTREPLRT